MCPTKRSLGAESSFVPPSLNLHICPFPLNYALVYTIDALLYLGWSSLHGGRPSYGGKYIERR